MPAQDDIEQQQQLLAVNRRNLAHELGRAAQYGGSARAPVEVVNACSIQESRHFGLGFPVP